jgi:Dolichyl-phosphate-mannose-protein mannosyltransferase
MSRRRILIFLLVALAASLYFAMLVSHASYAAGGSDTSGYMNEARMIRRGEMQRPMEMMQRLRPGPMFAPAFAPLGFTPAVDDSTMMVPTYPPGLPMQSALLGLLFGWGRAPFLVAAIAAMIALVFLYLTARELGLPRLWSAGATAILGVSATFLCYALQPASDGVATAWTLVAIYCALRGRRDPRFAMAAGVAWALSVAVRPTNVLIGLPLAFALEWKPRRLALLVAGSLPLAVALMWWNNAQYGAPWKSGYGDLDVLFSFGYLRTHVPHYSYWLMKTLTPLVFPAGLLVALDRRVARHDRAMLVSWFGVLFVCYVCYGPYETWWYTRFLLPGIPPLILGAVLVLRDSVEAWLPPRKWRPVLAAAVVLAVVITCAKKSESLGVFGFAEEELIYPRVVRWAEPLLPRDAIVITMQASGAFLYYSGRNTARWDWLDNARFQELRAYAGAANLHWYAVTFEFETKDFQQRCRGKWTPIARYREATIWRLDS